MRNKKFGADEPKQDIQKKKEYSTWIQRLGRSMPGANRIESKYYQDVNKILQTHIMNNPEILGQLLRIPAGGQRTRAIQMLVDKILRSNN
jgi:hypothetical protein